MPSKIRKCTCHHPFQDKTYGRGLRVHNESNNGDKCTVCGTAKHGKAPKIKKGE